MGWKTIGCRSCDLGMGTRGMDRCSKCHGTGSKLLHIESGDEYPNTYYGWLKLEDAHGLQPEHPTTQENPDGK